jgi:hypothetical protein
VDTDAVGPEKPFGPEALEKGKPPPGSVKKTAYQSGKANNSSVNGGGKDKEQGPEESRKLEGIFLAHRSREPVGAGFKPAPTCQEDVQSDTDETAL